MSGGGISAKGTKLYIDIAMVMTEIANVTNINTNGVEVGVIENSDLNQATAGECYIPSGYSEGGQVDFDKHFDPAGVTDQALTDLVTTPALNDFRIDWSDTGGTQWTFTGIYRGPNVSANMREKLVSSNSIKLDGLFAYPT